MDSLYGKKMNRLPITAVLIVLLLAALACAQNNIEHLKLIKALPIEYEEQVEPSGLTKLNGTLFTISDDHDIIFKIHLKEDRAVLEPYIELDLPKTKKVRKYDFEGITVDEDGDFYLASETTFRILKVGANGKDFSWITPSLKSFGRQKGLFKNNKANFEGITYIGKNTFILCAERESRGFIQVNIEKIPDEVQVIVNESSAHDWPETQDFDYTGLHYTDHSLYVLERGAGTICEITLQQDRVIEKSVWSYAKIENSKELQYKSMKYGRGEGLFIDENIIYVILDNNGDPRKYDSSDKRPLLLIMERPK